ncbi:roadblock/LC7 domain-containing protein [Streptomyces sp. NPDC020983]|uniref:roadblock/LC7 domain-containing protein n=1 Tax=Streptomyces sp. NPDC020983 TaxID=3365106 RepID=UPI0037ABA0BA
MAHEAAIRTELEGLRARLPDVTGVVAATADGLLLADDAPGRPAEGFAALSAAALGLGLRLADAAGQEPFHELLIRTGGGCVALYPAGSDAVLLVLSGPQTNVGRLHLESRRSGARVAALLDGSAARSADGGAP